jgi:hypothetical protein
MNNSDQNAREGDITGIRSDISERILALWRTGKTLREISEELDLPIEIVKRILKARQKTLIQKGSLKL